MPAPVDADKLNEYLSDMISFLSRQERQTGSYEPEEQIKFRYARNALEVLQNKVDEGAFS